MERINSPHQSSNDLRFQLKASPDDLDKMSTAITDAPTYMVRLLPDSGSIQLKLSEKKTFGLSDRVPISTRVLFSSLFEKLQRRELHTLEGPKKRYELLRILGEGGAGKVFSMMDHNFKREVAVKVLKTNHSEIDLKSFVREGMVAAKLDHPNIIPIYDIDVDDNGNVFLTMKKVEGYTLKDYVNQSDLDTTNIISSIDDIVRIILKVCDALEYAHSCGRIHQDIKPENIMIGEFGQVFLIDWGAASAIGDDIQLSPVYMSPQQARGYDPDVRDDVYCLGASLFHVVTGRFPTMAATMDELWEKKVAGFIDPLDAKDTGHVPPSLMAVVLKALQPDPDNRYRSIHELSEDLKAYQHGRATTAENAGFFQLMSLLIKRRWKETVAILLFLSTIGGLAAFDYRRIRMSKLEAERSAIESAEHAKTAKANEDRANAFLDELKKTAPTFHNQATMLLADRRLPIALERISFAVDLDPKSAKNHILKCRILIGLMKPDDALESLKNLDAKASKAGEVKTLSSICYELKRIMTIDDDSMKDRYYQVLIKHRLHREAAFVGRNVQSDKDRMMSLAKKQIEEAAPKTNYTLTWFKSTISDKLLLKLFFTEFSSGITWHKLTALPIGDLTIMDEQLTKLNHIARFPLERLTIRGTGVTDLAPLGGMTNIHTLDISFMKVTDLAPLAFLPLKRLHLRNMTVDDLAPLQDLPLEILELTGLPVSDLRPLRHLPLKALGLSQCVRITNYKPVANLKSLEVIRLPRSARDYDLTPLQTLPNLVSILNERRDKPFDDYLKKGQTEANADAFWKELNEKGKR